MPVTHSSTSRVLPRAYVSRRIRPTRKGKFVESAQATFEPSQDARTSRLKELELNRSAGLALYYDRARADPAPADEIANPNRHEVAAAQFAIDCKVEHGSIANAGFAIKPKPDGPDL